MLQKMLEIMPQQVPCHNVGIKLAQVHDGAKQSLTEGHRQLCSGQPTNRLLPTF